MISAIFSMTIISMVTVSLLVAITIGTKSINEAGIHPLSKQERELIINNGYNLKDLESIELQIKNLLSDK